MEDVKDTTHHHDCDDSEAEYSRRSVLGSMAVAPTALWFGPLNAAGADKLTPLALSDPADAITFGANADPSWLWTLDGTDESWNALDTWASGADGREVLRELPGLDAAVVRASRSDVGAPLGWLARTGGGAAGRDWVRQIDLNVELTLAEPERRRPLEEADGKNLQYALGTLTSAWMRYVESASASAPTPEAGDTGLATGEDTEVRPVGDGHQTMEMAAQSQAAGGSVDTSEIRVGVIDTGCNVDGNAITAARIVGSSTDYTSDGDPTVDEEGVAAVEDGDDHGTWCSANIASNPASAPTDAVGSSASDYRGPLPNAELWIGKALNDDGSGSTETIAAAVEGAIDAECDVVCMSLGSPFYAASLADAIQSAVDEGVTVIVAAGNDRYGTTWIASPASSEPAIGIHATTAAPDDPESVQPAYFANVGPHPGTTDVSDGATSGARPAFAVPGMDLESIVPRSTGASGLETMSGTSMAAPNVAAVFGLVQAATDLDAPDDIQARLRETAYRPPNLATVEGLGLPSAERAIAHETTEDTQADAMNDAAAARDTWYRSWSDLQGGLLTRYIS